MLLLELRLFLFPVTPELVDLFYRCFSHLGDFCLDGQLAFGYFLFMLLVNLLDCQLPCLFIYGSNNVMREVKHPLQIPRREVEQQAQPAGDSPGKPDMAHRTGKLDMPHPFPAYLRLGYLDPALIADNAFIAYPFILTAIAFKVLGRPEDSLTEKTVSFRFEGTVINRLRFGYLTVRPASYLLR